MSFQRWLEGHCLAGSLVPASAKATSNGLARIWKKTRIPMTYQPHIVSKVKACVDEYNLIKKNKRRASKSQIAREKDFSIKLDLLFDISHKDANKLIKIDEDKIILEDQKNASMMKMGWRRCKIISTRKANSRASTRRNKKKAE